MNFKNTIWRLVLDPVVKRIENRIDHFRTLRSVTNDGSFWRNCAEIGEKAKFYPEAILVNGGNRWQLSIGDFCHIRGEVSVLGAGAFEIGHHSFIGPQSRIWCRNQIKIGSHVLISHLVDIHDSNSHSLNFLMRRREGRELFENDDDSLKEGVDSAPIVIEDDAWIGFKSSILKGVRVGRGAVVAASSVVTKDVPPYTLVAGNPARIVKELPH